MFISSCHAAGQSLAISTAQRPYPSRIQQPLCRDVFFSGNYPIEATPKTTVIGADTVGGFVTRTLSHVGREPNTAENAKVFLSLDERRHFNDIRAKNYVNRENGNITVTCSANAVTRNIVSRKGSVFVQPGACLIGNIEAWGNIVLGKGACVYGSLKSNDGNIIFHPGASAGVSRYGDSEVTAPNGKIMTVSDKKTSAELMQRLNALAEINRIEFYNLLKREEDFSETPPVVFRCSIRANEMDFGYRTILSGEATATHDIRINNDVMKPDIGSQRSQITSVDGGIVLAENVLTSLPLKAPRKNVFLRAGAKAADIQGALVVLGVGANADDIKGWAVRLYEQATAGDIDASEILLGKSATAADVHANKLLLENHVKTGNVTISGKRSRFMEPRDKQKRPIWRSPFDYEAPCLVLYNRADLAQVRIEQGMILPWGEDNVCDSLTWLGKPNDTPYLKTRDQMAKDQDNRKRL